MKIYCISGLGADFRMFQSLSLPTHQLLYLDWISPIKDEKLEAYALRLGSEIDDSKPYGIMGLSFGGMLAVELAKQLKPKMLIVISSATVYREIPRTYRQIGRMLVGLVPDSLLQTSNPIVYFAFGAKTDIAKKNLDRAIKKTDVVFLRWAIKSILNWRNDIAVNCIRIHGDKDKILPLGKAKVDLILQGGGHMSIMSHGRMISDFLNDIDD